MYFKVYDSIFSQLVHCLFNFSSEDYAKWLKKNKIKDTLKKENYLGWTSEIIMENNLMEIILFIPNFDWTIQNQGTMIHEITHVIIKIWDKNNIPYNSDTQEFLAHSISNMFEDIAKKILKLNK